MSIAFRHRKNDWLMSPEILREAGRMILADVRVVRDYDVPYVAGYDKRGKIAYIDHALPRGFEDPRATDGFFDVTIPLVVHEIVEAGLEEEMKSLPYQPSHQCALHVEKALVEADGIDWVTYNGWFARQIKTIGGRSIYPHCPPQLDLEPYLDEEDWETLKKMYELGGRPLWNGKREHPDVR